VTSNLHPSGFDTIMPKTLATTTVDRLLHHAHVVLTEGAADAELVRGGRDQPVALYARRTASWHASSSACRTVLARFVSDQATLGGMAFVMLTFPA
jgi:hypothetical protein